MNHRKPHKPATLKTLQSEIGSVCPLCQSKDVEQFEVHHIDDNPENNELSNLIMLCPTCHSKITKGNISKEEVIKTKRKISGETKPKLPKSVEDLLNTGRDLRNESKFDEAGAKYVEALEDAEKLKDDFAIHKCKLNIASILNDKNEFPDTAKEYIIECENYFRENSFETNLADALYQYAVSEIHLEEFDSARIHLFESIKLNEKHNDTTGVVECYHQMGWLEHGNGHLGKAKDYYKKGIEICEKEFHKHDKKIITGLLGALYSHIALVNKGELNITEVEKNLDKGLEYFRQAELKISIGQTLFMLAELKLKTQEIEIGQQYLIEALNLFDETKNYRWLAEGLNLLSLIQYNFGSKEKGKEIFKEAIRAIEQTDDVRNKLKYYCKLAELYKIEEDFEEAEKLFRQVIEVANQSGEDEEYFKATIDLVRIKHDQKDIKERNNIANDGVEYLRKVLVKTQRESKRAQTLGDIAAIYTECENYQEATKYFILAKDAFLGLQDKRGLTKCLGALAYVYHVTRNHENEAETNKELHQLTAGTHNYFARASAAFNLCVYEIDNHHFDQAQKYFDEAEYLNYNYELDIDEKLDELECILEKAKDSLTKPDRGINELIMDLYNLLSYYPNERRDLLRFWIFYNGSDLFVNYRLLEGLKFLVVTDEIKSFLQFSQNLNCYSELFIQSFSKKFERQKMSLFHYPYECQIPKGVSILLQDKGQKLPKDLSKTEITISKLSKEEFNKSKNGKPSIFGRQKSSMGDYTIFFVVDKDMNHSKEATKSWHKILNQKEMVLKSESGNIIMGYHIQFPAEFENLILNSTPHEFIAKKVFFDLTNRAGYKDRLLTDLMMSDQLGFIPVYENKLPKSDRVFVIEQVSIQIPHFEETDFLNYASSISKIKICLLKNLLKIKQDSISAKSLKYEIDDLTSSFKDFISFEVFVLQYETYGKTENQVAFTYKP
jgi:tetratricopeptide (TPR) repeat protein